MILIITRWENLIYVTQTQGVASEEIPDWGVNKTRDRKKIK